MKIKLLQEELNVSEIGPEIKYKIIIESLYIEMRSFVESWVGFYFYDSNVTATRRPRLETKDDLAKLQKAIRKIFHKIEDKYAVTAEKFRELDEELENLGDVVLNYPQRMKNFEKMSSSLKKHEIIEELGCIEFLDLRLNFLSRTISESKGEVHNVNFMNNYLIESLEVLESYKLHLEESLERSALIEQKIKKQKEIDLTEISLENFEEIKARFDEMIQDRGKYDQKMITEFQESLLPNISKNLQDQLNEYRENEEKSTKEITEEASKKDFFFLDLLIEAYSKMAIGSSVISRLKNREILTPDSSNYLTMRGELIEQLEEILKKIFRLREKIPCENPDILNKLKSSNSFYINNYIDDENDVRKITNYNAKILLKNIGAEALFSNFFEVFEKKFEEKTFESCLEILVRINVLKFLPFEIDDPKSLNEQKIISEMSVSFSKIFDRKNELSEWMDGKIPEGEELIDIRKSIEKLFKEIRPLIKQAEAKFKNLVKEDSLAIPISQTKLDENTNLLEDNEVENLKLEGFLHSEEQSVELKDEGLIQNVMEVVEPKKMKKLLEEGLFINIIIEVYTILLLEEGPGFEKARNEYEEYVGKIFDLESVLPEEYARQLRSLKEKINSNESNESKSQLVNGLLVDNFEVLIKSVGAKNCLENYFKNLKKYFQSRMHDRYAIVSVGIICTWGFYYNAENLKLIKENRSSVRMLNFTGRFLDKMGKMDPNLSEEEFAEKIRRSLGEIEKMIGNLLKEEEPVILSPQLDLDSNSLPIKKENSEFESEKVPKILDSNEQAKEPNVGEGSEKKSEENIAELVLDSEKKQRKIFLDRC